MCFSRGHISDWVVSAPLGGLGGLGALCSAAAASLGFLSGCVTGPDKAAEGARACFLLQTLGVQSAQSSNTLWSRFQSGTEKGERGQGRKRGEGKLWTLMDDLTNMRAVMGLQGVVTNSLSDKSLAWEISVVGNICIVVKVIATTLITVNEKIFVWTWPVLKSIILLSLLYYHILHSNKPSIEKIN